MADNVAITAGSGTTVGTDDVAGVHYQKIKLFDGTADSAAEIPGTNTKGLYVDIRGSASRIQVASAGLTTATTAYTAGDQLGTEMTFASAARVSGGTSTVVSATLVDKAKVVGAVDLFLFDRSVTPAADNAANSWSDADMLFCLGVISFYSMFQSANNYIGVAGGGLPLIIQPNATSIFGHLITRSGHTFFGAVGDLVVSLGIVQD